MTDTDKMDDEINGFRQHLNHIDALRRPAPSPPTKIERTFYELRENTFTPSANNGSASSDATGGSTSGSGGGV